MGKKHTTEGAAEFLGVKPSWLRANAAALNIPRRRLGARIFRYDEDELQSWLDSQPEA